MPKRPIMNLRQYWDAVGTKNIHKVIAECGSSLSYFRMYRYGIKKPGRARALEILAAARKITPPYEPDLELMLAGVPRAGKNPVAEIMPDPAFIRANMRQQAEDPPPAPIEDGGIVRA